MVLLKGDALVCSITEEWLYLIIILGHNLHSAGAIIREGQAVYKQSILNTAPARNPQLSLSQTYPVSLKLA